MNIGKQRPHWHSFRAYFYKRRKEGLPYKKAVLATAHKLIRVMFSMLVHQKCFEEGGK
jgi:hypothetical protein